MLRAIFYIALMSLAFTACKSSKPAHTAEEQAYEAKPEWLNSRPISSAYYVGIGSASKTREPLDYAQVAKKNALNDLASEISVVIKGESFLSSLELNQHFQEEFVSNISTSTQEQIEGFEMQGAWENESEYWVYYKLSKADHARIKKEKKDKALSVAYDYYLKAKDAAKNSNVLSAVDLYLNGLFALQDYWNDNNEYHIDGQKVFLDNEIFQSLKTLISSLKIEPMTDRIVLSHDNQFREEVKMFITLHSKKVSSIPVSYKYDKGKYSKSKSSLSNDQGMVNIPVYETNRSNKENALELEIDLDKMIGEHFDKRLIRPIKQSLQVDKEQIPIQIIFPSIFLSSDEKSFNESLSNKHLAYTLENTLGEAGFRIAPSASSADYHIRLNANTTQGGTSQGFHVAYLDMTINVLDFKNDEEVYKNSFTKIKGLQLNFDGAGMEAYKKASKKMQKEIARDIINSIM